MKMEYFGSHWCQNVGCQNIPENIALPSVLYVQLIHMKMEQLLVLTYFGQYFFAFRIICTLHTHEIEIFQQLLVPKYLREYCFAFGVICAVNTHENGIFQQLLVPKYLGEYHFAFGICAVNTHNNEIFWQLLVLKYFR